MSVPPWPVRASAEMNQHTYPRASPSTPVGRTEAQAHTGGTDSASQ
ncbi:hypothetical protein J003_00978 [Cryptococcus neoformans]|nr:hypothetical protein J003_00978 [Cryptococcus neoformans var. grubii]